MIAEQQTSPSASFFGGAQQLGLQLLGAWGQSKIDAKDAKTQQATLAAEANATSKKTMFIIAGIALVVVGGFIVWRLFKK